MLPPRHAKDFPERLTAVMRQRGLSPEQLAQLAGITAGSVNRYLGDRMRPKPVTREKLMSALLACPVMSPKPLPSMFLTPKPTPEQVAAPVEPLPDGPLTPAQAVGLEPMSPAPRRAAREFAVSTEEFVAAMRRRGATSVVVTF